MSSVEALYYMYNQNANDIGIVVSSIRSRLTSLRKKIALMAKHSSVPVGTSPGKATTIKARPASPAIPYPVADISPPR